MKNLSDLLVVVAAFASLAASAVGFSAASWNGFWSGSGFIGVLYVLSWLLPALTVFGFIAYLVSRPVGLLSVLTLAIGGLVAVSAFSALSHGPLGIFIIPFLQVVSCAALYGDSVIQKKSPAVPKV